MIYIILVYLFSTYFTWLYFKITYSKGGRWENLKPDIISIFLTICPIFNTYMTIISFLFFPPKKRDKKDIDYRKFFNIK